MHMSVPLLLIVFALFAAILLAGVYLLLKKFAPRKQDDSQGLMMLQNQMNEIVRSLNTSQQESLRTIQSQFGSTQSIVKDVTERLTKFEETNKQVVNIADQLKGLEDILKNPKQRGILGEYFLETVLKNVLPPGTFAMQHGFKNGDIVDAVVFVKDKIIPIDSKFSLENYNRLLAEKNPAAREEIEKQFKSDLKKRIDETSKYIRPDEGTMDFAFMFIPSEGIYYDLLINEVGAVKVNTRDLIEYAFRDKKVIIVSPTSFLAYLQTVLQGLRALQIEDSAKEITKRVGELGQHLKRYEDYMKKMGGHLSTTVNMYNDASKELGKIDKDVMRITGVKVGLEPVVIDRPQESE
jgi:DNA recombination protein RmuC